MRKGIFITGTDTSVGKTIVSSIITAGLNGIYWKPIQAGTQEETDSEFITRTLGTESVLKEHYLLKHPLSPHHAAHLEGKKLSMRSIVLPETKRPIIVEGAGGLFVPINQNKMMIDLIKKLELPCLLVAKSGLGTLNHTLLSLNALKQASIPILGVILNGPKNQMNKASIEYFGEVKVILEIEHCEHLTKKLMLEIYQQIQNKDILHERTYCCNH